MKSKDITGTPWHTEKATRKDGDEKRHRSRCIFFRKRDRYCIERLEGCIGSAHCQYYKENNAKKDVKKTVDIDNRRVEVSGNKIYHDRNLHVEKFQYRNESFYKVQTSRDQSYLIPCSDAKDETEAAMIVFNVLRNHTE